MSIGTLEKALGLDALHVAVFQGNLKKVKELLRGGVDINQKSRTLKMTALHFAIILRKYHIACFLIRKGGDLQAADEKGRTPVKYNKKKLGGKYLALFKTLGFQHEVSVGVQSRKLSSLFRYPVAMRSLLGKKKHALSKSVMYLHGKTVLVAKQIAKISLPELGEKSTYGYIAGPEDQQPKVYAISGWKHSQSTLPKRVLPNSVFMQLTRDTAAHLGFQLPRQIQDSPGSTTVAPSDVGRYFASHVEKQLGVFWVLFLLHKYLDTGDFTRIEELRGFALRDNEDHARIFIDHNPCDNCLGFLSSLERATGVKFIVEPIPYAVKGERQPKGCPNCSCDSCERRPPLPQARVTPPAKTLEDDGDNNEVTNEELAPLRDFIRKNHVQGVARSGIEPTSPPGHWIQYRPGEAKPPAQKVNEQEYHAATSKAGDGSSQISASQESGVVPISTIDAGRSAYFASPSVEPPLVTRSRSGSPTQAERAPSEIVESAASTSPPRAESTPSEIEEVSSQPVVEIFEPSVGWHAPSIAEDPVDTNPRPRITIDESRRKLNLSRFSLSGRAAASSPASAPRRKRGRPKGSKNKKPSRAAVRKEAMAREKSTFAQAFRFHQKRNQRSHGDRRTRARNKTPTTPTTLAKSSRAAEKVCRDTQKYFDNHMRDGTLPNDIEPQICRHGLDMPYYL